MDEIKPFKESEAGILRPGYNQQFAILSTLAMIFTVMGHTGVSTGTIDWLFPYDSYHMPLFVFISGYFFKTEEVCWKKTGHYLWKQMKRLLIPFFVWNLIYGLISQVAFQTMGIEWCHANEFLYRVLVLPFTYGNCFFEFNAPSWFILMLFEVKILNWFLHSVFRRTNCPEMGISIVYLLFAFLAVTGARNLERTWEVIAFTRAFYMLFWFEIGTLYKCVLEKFDTMKNSLYFSIVLMAQFVLIILCGQRGMIAPVYNSEFTNCAGLTIMSAATGIAFFLRLAKILTASVGRSKLVHYISTHTFSIMMHQITAFAILNILFYFITQALNINSFDLAAFQTNQWYRFYPMGLSTFNVLYLLAGFVFPLSGCWLWETANRKINFLFKNSG